MKNITVTVDEDLYHRARVQAAAQRTTVSAMVRKFLQQMTAEEDSFERLARQQNDLIAKIRAENVHYSASQRLKRDDAHERNALR